MNPKDTPMHKRNLSALNDIPSPGFKPDTGMNNRNESESISDQDFETEN